jgi:hypothetical protein
MRFPRARSFSIAAILATATFLATVATVLADGNVGPIPH